MTVAHSRSTVEHLARPGTRGIGLDVFAVEDRSAQVLWSDLPACRVTVTCRRDDRVVWQRTLDHLGGPGAVELTELLPESRHEVELHSSDGHHARRDLRTLATPPGEELFRFATLNDLHLGREEHRSMAGHPHRRRPFDMADDALADALAWGAELVVLKGDVCDESYERFWDQAAELLRPVPVDVVMLPGNHDTGSLRRVEPEVAAAARGLRMIRDVEHLDIPGLRVVMMESGVPGNGWGHVARHADQVAALAADGRGDGRATFVATHHQAQRFRVPYHWPHGIPAPDAKRFARALHAADPAAMISSGHTHRCRLRGIGGVTWSEVAATNHFPAVWAGYRVFAGGLMQVVRRTAAPEALAWSEHGRSWLRGVWALWSTGSIQDRCFTRAWDHSP